MMTILKGQWQAARDERGFQVLGQAPGQFDQRSPTAGRNDHIVLDECGGLSRDQLFLRVGIDRGSRMLVVGIRQGEGASMHLYQFLSVRELLEIPPDRVFRDL